VALPQPKRAAAPLIVTERGLDRRSDFGHRRGGRLDETEAAIVAPGAVAGETCDVPALRAESLFVTSPSGWRQRLHPVTGRRNAWSIRVRCREAGMRCPCLHPNAGCPPN
jgi:hypothetical protein